MWHIGKEYDKKGQKIIPKTSKNGFTPMLSMCGRVKLFDTTVAPEEFFIRAAGSQGAVCANCLLQITETVEPEDLSPLVKRQLRSSTRKSKQDRRLGKRSKTSRTFRTGKKHAPQPQTDSPTEPLGVSSLETLPVGQMSASTAVQVEDPHRGQNTS
jgi:hypothetical protein